MTESSNNPENVITTDDDGTLEEKEEEPDWNLFHALQATQGSISQLRQQSRAAPLGPNAEDNLRAIESFEGNGNGIGDLGLESVSPSGQTGTETYGTPSTRFAGTPGQAFMGQVGRRMRTESGQIGSSPLARQELESQYTTSLLTASNLRHSST